MKTITIEVESTLHWTAVHTESGVWVAECEALGLTMEGDSLDDLHGVIGEACGTLFADLIEDDELDEFLRSRGWRASGLPDAPAGQEVEFEVPWRLVTPGGSHGTARRPH